MKRICLIIALLSGIASAQIVRFDVGTPGGSGATTTQGTGLPFVVAIPNVTLNWCNYPANAVPCTNFATTYTSLTGVTACPTNAQVVLQGSSTCQATSDNFGNLGVYTNAGTYAYTLTSNGTTVGPFVVSVNSGGGSSTPSSGAVVQQISFSNVSTLTFPTTFTTTAVIPYCFDNNNVALAGNPPVITPGPPVTVVFSFAGTQSGYCNVAGNGPNVTPPPPPNIFSVTPSALGFGNVALNTNSPPMTVTLSNNTLAPVTGITTAISGPNAADFLYQQILPTFCQSSTLAPGASCTLQYQFRPSQTSAESATVTVTDSAGTQTVSLSGTGFGAQSLSFSPSVTTGLNFANTIQGQTSAPIIETISNTGTAPVPITSISFGTSQYTATFSGTNCTTIPVGGNCQVSTVFNPSAAGTFADSLTIVSGVGTTAIPVCPPSGCIGISNAPPTASTLAISPLSPSIALPNQQQQMNAVLTNTASVPTQWTAEAWWGLTSNGSGTSTPTIVNQFSVPSPGYCTTLSYSVPNTGTCVAPISGTWTVNTGDELMCIDTIASAGGRTVGISDSLGNSWTSLTAQTASNGYQRGFYTKVAAGGSDTITLLEAGGSAVAQTPRCLEVSNLASSAFDTSASATSSSSATISSGSFTTTANGDFVFAQFADGSSGGPFTVIDWTGESTLPTVMGSQSPGYAEAAEYQVVGNSGAYTAKMTNTATDSTGLGFAMAFKAGGGTGSVASISNSGLISPLTAGTATVNGAGANFVQSMPTTSPSTATLTATLMVAQGPGNTNQLFILWPQTSGSCTALAASNPVVDTAGNTYVKESASVISGNGLCGQGYYAQDIIPASGGNSNPTTVTVTWASAVSNPYIIPMEYAGLTNTTLDVFGGSTGSGTSGTNAVTTVNATDLVVSVCYSPTGSNLSNNGTNQGTATSTIAQPFAYMVWTAGSTTPTCTQSGQAWLMLSAAFATPAANTGLTVTSGGGANVRYISSTGSDSNSGGALLPWLTWAHALSNISAGFTIIALPGTMNASNSGLMNIKCGTGLYPNGTAANPITIIASQERQTVIDGGGQSGITTFGCSYYTIQGFEVINEDVNLYPCNYSNILLQNSTNITLKRNLVNHTNGFCNAHGIQVTNGSGASNNLITQNEIYNFHRHGIYDGYSVGGDEISQNYMNPRARGDVAGCQGTACQSNGHFCSVIYPGQGNTIENNICDTLQVPNGSSAGPSQPGFDEECDYSPGNCGTNTWYGNMVFNTVIGFRMAARCSGGETCSSALQPNNDTWLNNVHVNNVTDLGGGQIGFYPRSTLNTIGNHMTFLAFAHTENGINTISGLADYQTCVTNAGTFACGGGTYSATLKNSYSYNFGVGYNEGSGCGSPCSSYTWTWDHLAYNNLGSVGSTVTNPQAQSTQALGTCYAWVPTASPLKGIASDSTGGYADAAANILYETNAGTLGTTPIWSIHNVFLGQAVGITFEGALDVLGINSVAGKSMYDFAGRFHVNTNGCGWPTGYTPN